MKKENFVSLVLGTIGGIFFSLGMCMCMVWEGMLIKGIIVGTAGIVILLSLIPAWKGIK